MTHKESKCPKCDRLVWGRVSWGKWADENNGKYTVRNAQFQQCPVCNHKFEVKD